MNSYAQIPKTPNRLGIEDEGIGLGALRVRQELSPVRRRSQTRKDITSIGLQWLAGYRKLRSPKTPVNAAPCAVELSIVSAAEKQYGVMTSTIVEKPPAQAGMATVSSTAFLSGCFYPIRTLYTGSPYPLSK